MSIGIRSDPTGFETLESFSRIPSFNHWLYDKIKGYATGQILEIGSGIGNISVFLLRDQPAVSLSDLRPEYTHLLNKNFKGEQHMQGVYELDLALPDFMHRYPDLLEKFDTVIALNVIEHIGDDELAIRNATSLLRKNGKLVILVPAGQWLYNSLDRELGHCKRYSKKSLNNLLKSAGLEISDSKYFNAAAILGWWFSGNILHEKIISPVKLKVYNLMVPFFRILDWFISGFIGISVISIGSKNNVNP
jgi:2-polyprenyl-3-methyl-5-hydroxy-6-metoxy-1,4-benzoquinol methylase